MIKAMTLVFVSVFLILLITADADDEIESPLDGFLVYPVMQPKLNIRKRDTAASNRSELKESNNDQFQRFLLDKLLQHSKVLEHVMEKVDSNEENIKRLINNFVNQTLEPKMPENVHVPTASPEHFAEPDHPVVKFGKNISKYGVLVKDMIVNDMREESEPVALVEYNLTSNSSNAEGAPLSLSRRSFGGGPRPEFSPPPAGVSPWCLVATLCRKNAVPICGFDENFGYGKFNDLCHMLQVNCFYKYNFGVVAHCKPFYV